MHTPDQRACRLTFQISPFFPACLCHLSGILCTILFSSKPICICIANIHFHFGFMCLPSLLIGFGSFPNVQSVPRNNYIPEESRMNFVADFDGFSAHRRRQRFISCERRVAWSKDVGVGAVNIRTSDVIESVQFAGLLDPQTHLITLERSFMVFFLQKYIFKVGFTYFSPIFQTYFFQCFPGENLTSKWSRTNFTTTYKSRWFPV